MSRFASSATERIIIEGEDWIDVRKELSLEQMERMDLEGVRNGGTQTKQMVEMLAACIVDWSFTDDNGVKVEACKENIRRLKFTEIEFIVPKVLEAVGFGGGATSRVSSMTPSSDDKSTSSTEMTT